MYIYMQGRRYNLNPADAIGKGGEADIFLVQDLAVKIFKPPNHPDFVGFSAEQQAAQFRLDEHQRKLPDFPHGLPSRVISPQELVRDQAGQRILGYAMQFLPGAEVLYRFTDKRYREQRVPTPHVVQTFLDLHSTVAGLHARQVVIGDFNDLNVLVYPDKPEAYLIDADSMQFGPYQCRLFTARFVDPLRCDAHHLILAHPHVPESDWYAFNVMLMQCLLFVGPYGGVYMPKGNAPRIPHDSRPLKRITVFNPDVIYPKPAVPYSVLPDDLLQHFHLVFERDQRGTFPRPLLERLRWTTCSGCGKEHARATCPFCQHAAPAAIQQVVTMRGTVKATRVFRTSGRILAAAYQDQRLRTLCYERDAYVREADRVIAREPYRPDQRIRLMGDTTLIGRGSDVTVYSLSQPPRSLSVDTYRHLPMFDANATQKVWVSGGQLQRDGKFGDEFPETLGNVLQRQTLLWLGPSFGFGFYRAGDLAVSFVFDAQRQGLNDSVNVPLHGQLVDATCVFSKDRCWFLTVSQEHSRIVHRCTVIRPDGTVDATLEAAPTDVPWLANIRGKAAVGSYLFAATDAGLVRVEAQQGVITQTRDFPDTEPFVDAGSRLVVGGDGIYVIEKQEITRLELT